MLDINSIKIGSVIRKQGEKQYRYIWSTTAGLIFWRDMILGVADSGVIIEMELDQWDLVSWSGPIPEGDWHIDEGDWHIDHWRSIIGDDLLLHVIAVDITNAEMVAWHPKCGLTFRYIYGYKCDIIEEALIDDERTGAYVDSLKDVEDV